MKVTISIDSANRRYVLSSKDGYKIYLYFDDMFYGDGSVSVGFHSHQSVEDYLEANGIEYRWNSIA